MKVVKIALGLILTYVVIVVVFETLLGHYQPQNEGTLVLTTTDAEGMSNDRVLSKIEYNDQLYIAANHWPRAWYSQVLRSPLVEVALDGEQASYRAVEVTGAEHIKVDNARPLGLTIRLLTGFPPRYFVKLMPL